MIKEKRYHVFLISIVGIVLRVAGGMPNCCVNSKVFGVHIDGGMVECISVPADKLLHDKGLNFDELSLVYPLAIGANAIRRSKVEQRESVAVIEAGPIRL